MDALLFIIALVAVRRFPRISPLSAGVIMLLLIQGWVMTWNAPPQDSDPSILPWKGGFSFLPASASRDDSLHAMLLMTGLLAAFLIASDLSANRLWRMRLWYALALTGVSIVVLGLVQRLTNAPAIFWNVYENTGGTFFAVFRYHANAGAYINLVLPLIAGLAVLSVLEKWNEASRVFWISSALVTVAAVFVNVSRGAALVAGIMFVIGGFWLTLGGFIKHRNNRKAILAFIVIAVAAASLLSLSFGCDRLLTRWRDGGISDPLRMLTYQVIIQDVLPETGACGHGPGSFEQVFARRVSEQHLPVKGRWDKAHNDHLQTLVEWGWVGYTAWAVLLMGALLKGVLMTRRGNSPSARTLGFCGTISLAGVLLHGCVDFPLQIIGIEVPAALIAGLLWGKGESASS
jgi:hypothetical protein